MSAQVEGQWGLHEARAWARARLDEAGVELTDRGFVTVDEHLRTSAQGVWAAGDCAGTPMFTHASWSDFRIIRAQLTGASLEDATTTTRGRTIPYAVFATPELARIGLSEGEAREAGLSADLILCFLRDMSAQSALETLQAALPYKDMFIGVGLDSDERDNPPTKFAEVFALAREAGLHVTMHCDIDQVGSIDNIRAALTELGAERLDHGTNIVEDPELVAYARDHGIGLTSCPLSNSFVTEEMKGKEIVELTAAGVKVSVNSDDPAYFGGYVGDNYLALAERFDLGRADLERIARNSIDIAWIPDEQKKAMHARIDSFVAQD